MKHPEIQRLNELLIYDPTTGSLCWRVKKGKCQPGKPITCLNGSGYIVVRVDDVLLRAHRVAWAITHGKWPENEIDHINGNRSDNRLCNLRPATRFENMKNIKRPITNKSGVKGVSWHEKGQKWQAHIRADNINHYLGLYETKEEAHAAYVSASSRLHKMFSNHG